jgi:hypothetical protein
MHCREGRPDLIEIRIAPHGGIRGRCSLLATFNGL